MMFKKANPTYTLQVSDPCSLATSKRAQACMASHVLLFQTPWTVATRLLCPWDSPGKNWRRLPFPSPRIFPTQGSNPHLLHRQGDSLPSSHLGKPGIFFIMYILPQVKKKKLLLIFFCCWKLIKMPDQQTHANVRSSEGHMGGSCCAWGNHYHLKKLWSASVKRKSTLIQRVRENIMIETSMTRRISTVKFGEIIRDFSSAETKHWLFYLGSSAIFVQSHLEHTLNKLLR